MGKFSYRADRMHPEFIYQNISQYDEYNSTPLLWHYLPSAAIRIMTAQPQR
jgi:hypothetical protein